MLDWRPLFYNEFASCPDRYASKFEDLGKIEGELPGAVGVICVGAEARGG